LELRKGSTEWFELGSEDRGRRCLQGGSDREKSNAGEGKKKKHKLIKGRPSAARLGKEGKGGKVVVLHVEKGGTLDRRGG